MKLNLSVLFLLISVSVATRPNALSENGFSLLHSVRNNYTDNTTLSRAKQKTTTILLDRIKKEWMMALLSGQDEVNEIRKSVIFVQREKSKNEPIHKESYLASKLKGRKLHNYVVSGQYGSSGWFKWAATPGMSSEYVVATDKHATKISNAYYRMNLSSDYFYMEIGPGHKNSNGEYDAVNYSEGSLPNLPTGSLRCQEKVPRYWKNFPTHANDQCISHYYRTMYGKSFCKLPSWIRTWWRNYYKKCFYEGKDVAYESQWEYYMAGRPNHCRKDPNAGVYREQGGGERCCVNQRYAKHSLKSHEMYLEYKCLPGSYQQENNSAPMFPTSPEGTCNPNVFSNSRQCDSGQYSKGGFFHSGEDEKSTCIDCPTGKYQNEKGRPECKTCTFSL